jgi:hypothetical protein
MSYEEMRVEALKLAQAAMEGQPACDVVERAEEYYRFLCQKPRSAKISEGPKGPVIYAALCEGG